MTRSWTWRPSCKANGQYILKHRFSDAPCAAMVHFDCPDLDSLRDSHAITHKENKGQKRWSATRANSCKWDSTAPAGSECHAAAT
jgi:hypothetical protein